MPPKKSKDASKNNTSTKCKFNNRGYCKLKEQCDKKHSDIVCEDLDCTEEKCEKRHPNPCKFGPRCQFNKKNECLYLHVTLASDDQQIEALKAHFNSKFTKLDNSLTKIQKELEAKNSEINLLNIKHKDLEKLVNVDQINNLQKNL